MRIALDLDGVLADLQHAVIEKTEYTMSDFDQWEKPDYNHFMSEASRVWDDHWDEIPPVERNLDYKTAQLASNNHVDIVTNTVGSNVAITKWLDEHGIVFEEIIRPYSLGSDKPDLDYDAYIDDKPGMAGTVPLHYLRDQRWNGEVKGDEKYRYMEYEDGIAVDTFQSDCPWVIRVAGLDDVLAHLDR